MGKGTWKRRGIGNDRIREALRTSRTLSEAAKALGVNRSTLHRWIAAEPSLDAPRLAKVEAIQQAVSAAQQMSPSDWTEWIEKHYELSPTEFVFMDLARQCLEVANDSESPLRFQAMTRFESLVKALQLEEPANGKAQNRQLYSVK